MNPIIRWAGSKRQIVGALKAFWPKNATRYIEPFCGSACLFFTLEPAAAVLGDLNREVILTYRSLQRDSSLVFECLKRLPRGKAAYYRIRSIAPHSLTETEIAARFLYLNRYCFNGIYRTNQAGQFNVPYGPPKTDLGYNFAAIESAAKLLRSATLINGDFETTLSHVRCGDFVYLDPPYAVSDRRIFAEYHPSSFSVADLERLSKSLATIHQRGASFLVTYADSKEARLLLKPWKPKRIWTRRNIAGFAGHRRGSYELLATNLEG